MPNAEPMQAELPSAPCVCAIPSVLPWCRSIDDVRPVVGRSVPALARPAAAAVSSGNSAR